MMYSAETWTTHPCESKFGQWVYSWEFEHSGGKYQSACCVFRKQENVDDVIGAPSRACKKRRAVVQMGSYSME